MYVQLCVRITQWESIQKTFLLIQQRDLQSANGKWQFFMGYCYNLSEIVKLFSVLTCMSNSIKSSEVRRRYPAVTQYTHAHTYIHKLPALLPQQHWTQGSTYGTKQKIHTVSFPHRLRSHSRKNSMDPNIKLIFVRHSSQPVHLFILNYTRSFISL